MKGSTLGQLQELQVSLVLAFLEVSEDSSECCDGSDWLSIRRSVMSKLGDLWSLLTAFPSDPLAPSLLLRPSLECSALDTLDCISINSSVTSSAHWRKVYPTPLRLLAPLHRQWYEEWGAGVHYDRCHCIVPVSFQRRPDFCLTYNRFFPSLLRIATLGKICCQVLPRHDFPSTSMKYSSIFGRNYTK